jgi:hypothetical protein
MASALHGAGFPIRRADTTWGRFSAGLLDEDTFIAAGNAFGTATGSEISFIGKWDLEGNPIWEKSIPGWTDKLRSIRNNTNGTNLLLGNTYGVPCRTSPPTATLFLTFDREGNIHSPTSVSLPSPNAPDSAVGDSSWRVASDFLDFATVEGRNFLLGRDDRYGWPFLAEVDAEYRLIRSAYFSREDDDFVAHKIMPWNDKLLVLGSGGQVLPALLVVGLMVK